MKVAVTYEKETGSADEAAELFAKGELKPNFEAKCNHHKKHVYVTSIISKHSQNSKFHY